MFCKKKTFIDRYLKNGDFPSTSTASSTLTRIVINKGPSTKKVALPIIFYMPPWWPMYLFWEMSRVKGNFDGFLAEDLQTGSNWFLLSPTFNQKRKLLLRFSSLLYLIFLVSSIWWWLTHWRTHGGSYECELVVDNHDNLEKCNMHSVFQHWRILPKFQLWLL